MNDADEIEKKNSVNRSRKEMRQEYREEKKIGGVYGIRNSVSGKILILRTLDIAKAPNLFSFSKATESCVNPVLAEDWKIHGAETFTLEILEKLDKKDTQSEANFAEDIRTLELMWRDKIGTALLYDA